MPTELNCHGIFNKGAHFSPARALCVLKRDENHGVFPLLGAVFGILPHLRAFEEVRVARLRLLEERLEHPHRERLAKASRARENGNRGLLVEKPRYELRLVGRPVPGLDRGPVAVANGERWKPTPALDVFFLHVGILPHRPAPCNSERILPPRLRRRNLNESPYTFNICQQCAERLCRQRMGPHVRAIAKHI